MKGKIVHQFATQSIQQVPVSLRILAVRIYFEEGLANPFSFADAISLLILPVHSDKASLHIVHCYQIYGSVEDSFYKILLLFPIGHSYLLLAAFFYADLSPQIFFSAGLD